MRGVLGFAIAILLFSAPPASADPLTYTLSYDTLGSVGSQYGPSVGQIGFEPASASAAPLPGSIDLGSLASGGRLQQLGGPLAGIKLTVGERFSL